ncbi:MAG TPA: TIGR03862 family flavoprotein, partial [Xanthobacteraceae bacterium]|nr:TIGR03862 family flavoprotein [Xanthobacteraceae bacterium]
VFDCKPSLGRKFLLAGRGGLNLTHSEPLETFLTRYGGAREKLRPAIEAFPPEALRAWAKGLGQETFIGSSGRVFPKAMKASPLLRAWLRRLDSLGVTVRLRHRWRGWTERGDLVFETPDGTVSTTSDATVLALGGASWPRLGSAGDWVPALASSGVTVSPLKPANSGFLADWSEPFSQKFAGAPIKRAAFSCGVDIVRGEAIVTRHGLEGGAIYALSGRLRDAVAANGSAELRIDLRPDAPANALGERLAISRGKQSMATFLRKALSLSPATIGLLHEAALKSGARISAMTPAELAALIKSVSVRLTGIAPIDRAISTTGGISFGEIDEHFMLRKRPGVFVAGEMLDWEAPTGGYLLQACFATGAAAGRGASKWVTRKPQ